MALPWPHGTPTLPRPLQAVSPTAPSTPSRTATGTHLPARILAVATAPATALVIMLVGLTLLFVLPLVGLPFVALVVLPAVIYHLRAERRGALLPRG